MYKGYKIVVIHIHRQQQHARQQRGAAHHAKLALAPLIALGLSLIHI